MHFGERSEILCFASRVPPGSRRSMGSVGADSVLLSPFACLSGADPPADCRPRQRAGVRAIGRSSSDRPGRGRAGGETVSRHPRSSRARRSRTADPRRPRPPGARQGDARPTPSSHRPRRPILRATRCLARARSSSLAAALAPPGCFGVNSVLIFSLSGAISSCSSSCKRFGSANASDGAVAGSALTDSRKARCVSIRNSRKAIRFVSWRLFRDRARPSVCIVLDPLPHQLDIAASVRVVWLQFEAMAKRDDRRLQLVNNFLPFFWRHIFRLFARQTSCFFRCQRSQIEMRRGRQSLVVRETGLQIPFAGLRDVALAMGGAGLIECGDRRLWRRLRCRAARAPMQTSRVPCQNRPSHTTAIHREPPPRGYRLD